jgi:hypothetical protein
MKCQSSRSSFDSVDYRLLEAVPFSAVMPGAPWFWVVCDARLDRIPFEACSTTVLESWVFYAPMPMRNELRKRFMLSIAKRGPINCNSTALV